MNIAVEITAVWPELFMAVAAMAMLMYGAFRGEGSTRFVTWAGVLVLVVAALLVLAGPADRTTAFNGQFIVDAFAVFTKVLLIVGAALALILAQPYNMREDIKQFEYPILIVFAVLGMMMMVSANDLLSLYVGLELQSLALYVVAAIRFRRAGGDIRRRQRRAGRGDRRAGLYRRRAGLQGLGRTVPYVDARCV